MSLSALLTLIRSRDSVKGVLPLNHFAEYTVFAVVVKGVHPMSLPEPPVGTQQEEEWRELQAMLLSGILDKAPNLLNLLNYVAERHFSGATDQIKEYSIAVLALHRPDKFDPLTDTIVRVTAHALRKKLEQYYGTEGARHQIQVRFPAGKYILQFERKDQLSLRERRRTPDMTPVCLPGAQSLIEGPAKDALRAIHPKWLILVVLAVAAALVPILLGVGPFKHSQAGPAMRGEGSVSGAGAGSGALTTTGMAQDRGIRLRFGASPNSYTDVAGQTWSADQYCQGGSTFSHPNRDIQGTDDLPLFLNGRQGKFQCKIPVPAGSYQLLLLFANTWNDKLNSRWVNLLINNNMSSYFDSVDEAGGDDIVVGKVYTGIHPMSDGTIHLDFTSDLAFVNAAEITPSASDEGAPMRMLAGPEVFRDSDGNIWGPERFFHGGRRTFQRDNLPKISNYRLFEWARYGHFHYFIPVVAGKEYRVKLYFSEGWFGRSNGGPGGIDSRVFDVYCNGTTLLKDFDILRDQKNGTAVVTFDHVIPTAHGVLELYFTPIKNYPLINAIEVESES